MTIQYYCYLSRQGQFLNVRGEKTSEKTFYNALMKAVSNWEGLKLTDYCCSESLLISEEGKGILSNKDLKSINQL